MDIKKLGFATRQIHAGAHEKPKNAHIYPIFQSSTFVFDSPEHGAALFQDEIEGHIYSRLGNPTTESLERAMSALEGAEETIVLSSGMAAVMASMVPFLEAGDHVVAGNTLYGSSTWIIGELFPRWGIDCTFVDTSIVEAIRKAIRSETRLCFLETPANPTMSVADIEAIASICRDHGIRLIIDNTFATPYNQLPFKLGAHMVVHSATKYLNGHGDIIAGCVMGSSDDMALVKEYRTHTGPILSPLDSFLFMRGLRTLSMRMEKHNENALRIAKFLESHPDVSTVSYPGLASHPNHKVAKKQMTGFGGMIAFEMKGGFEAAKTLLKHTKIFTLAVSLGTIDSLIQHPASMTHANVPKEIRDAQGLTDSLIRMSVGCEDIADLIEDLEQAMSAVRNAVRV